MEAGTRNSDGSVVGIEALAADVEALRRRTRAVCTRLNQAHGHLVAVAVELLERGLWAEGGVRSPEHWLMVRAGVSPATARDVVRLARRSVELPEATEALRDGTLSLDQAAVVARHVPASHSVAATDLARDCTVPQLRRVLSRYSFHEPGGEHGPGADEGTVRLPPPTPAQQAGPGSVREDPLLTMATDPASGLFTLRFTAPVSVGALVEQAVREAKDALFSAGQTGATLADALVEVANRSLSGVEGTARSRKYQVNVHLDTDGGWLPGVGRVPDHLLRRMTCDGGLVPVWESEGRPVNLGRTTRIVPERIRRLVLARDGGCAYPGCVSTGHVDVHHVWHWSQGGPTDLDNLVALCAHHHDNHHAGAFGISADPDRPGRFDFTGRGGWRLRPLHADPPEPPGGPPAGDDVGHTHRDDDDGPPTPTWLGPTGAHLDTRWVDIRPNPPPPAA
jgi:hypothetical protein